MVVSLNGVEVKGGYSVVLSAPESYWLASPAELARICNGCGTSHSGWIVPDTMYLLDITPACSIHDWCYHVGETIDDKEQADRVFLNNLLRLIAKAPSGRIFLLGKLITLLRNRRALKYFEAVSLLGGPAFWAGKSSDR